MDVLHLDLTTAERDLLVRLLSTELGNTRVELRHTDFSVDFEQGVKREVALLRGLLEKLGAKNNHKCVSC